MKDRRHVLVKNSNNEVQLWDVITGRTVPLADSNQSMAEKETSTHKIMNDQSIGNDDLKRKKETKEKFELLKEMYDEEKKLVVMNSWIGIDIRLGHLGIKLEPKQCFSAEV